MGPRPISGHLESQISSPFKNTDFYLKRKIEREGGRRKGRMEERMEGRTEGKEEGRKKTLFYPFLILSCCQSRGHGGPCSYSQNKLVSIDSVLFSFPKWPPAQGPALASTENSGPGLTSLYPSYLGKWERTLMREELEIAGECSAREQADRRRGHSCLWISAGECWLEKARALLE